MSKPKIFIARQISPEAISMFKKQGYEVSMNNTSNVLGKRDLMKSVKGKDAILSLLTDKIDGKVMDAAGPGLKIIANYAVGFDNIDIDAAKKRGIIVTNTPVFASSNAVAEHTMALLQSINRRIVEADDYTRKGKYKAWDPMLFLGRSLRGRTLGLIGLGRIGSRVAEIAKNGFEMKVVYYDAFRNKKAEKSLGIRYARKDTVLKKSDFISLHVPLLPSTRHLLGAKEFQMMSPDACVINTSRGPVIHEKTLVTALKNKKIRGAALDVFEFEPKVISGLKRLPNAILTPHIASATRKVRIEMSECAGSNIINVLSGKKPNTPVC